MASNSKLTSVQKENRKDWIAQLPEGSSLATDWVNLTILAVPDGNITRVFSYVMSPAEITFRRKVGEYQVLSRFCWDGGGLTLPGRWHADDLIDMFGTT